MTSKDQNVEQNTTKPAEIDKQFEKFAAIEDDQPVQVSGAELKMMIKDFAKMCLQDEFKTILAKLTEND